MLYSLVTISLILASQALGSPLTTPNNNSPLEVRSGCIQRDCPDNKFGLDLLAWGKGGNNWDYYVRWQGRCGCNRFDTSDDGCVSFDICSGHHSVCFDYRNNRAHWIDPVGKRTCYSLNQGMVCQDYGGAWEAWPTAEIPCTW